MPTSSVGATSSQRRPIRSLTRAVRNRDRQGAAGVTLLEMLIVMTIVALVAGLSYPSISSGLDSLRLRSASDSIVSFLNTALDRAERRQQVVEIWISPRENAMTAVSADAGFKRRLDVPEPIRIVSVSPAVPEQPGEPRRFLLYPGGSVPRIGVEIANPNGRRRMVSVDPLTGVPRVVAP
jgi:prepilin-type N-terminal cleavage/methylation domain-containing protein